MEAIHVWNLEEILLKWLGVTTTADTDRRQPFCPPSWLPFVRQNPYPNLNESLMKAIHIWNLEEIRLKMTKLEWPWQGTDRQAENNRDVGRALNISQTTGPNSKSFYINIPQMPSTTNQNSSWFYWTISATRIFCFWSSLSFSYIYIGKNGPTSYRPWFSTDKNNLNNLSRRSSKDHLCQIIFYRHHVLTSLYIHRITSLPPGSYGIWQIQIIWTFFVVIPGPFKPNYFHISPVVLTRYFKKISIFIIQQTGPPPPGGHVFDGSEFFLTILVEHTTVLHHFDHFRTPVEHQRLQTVMAYSLNLVPFLKNSDLKLQGSGDIFFPLPSVCHKIVSAL